jgi:hypothetical protein
MKGNKKNPENHDSDDFSYIYMKVIVNSFSMNHFFNKIFRKSIVTISYTLFPDNFQVE